MQEAIAGLSLSRPAPLDTASLAQEFSESVLDSLYVRNFKSFCNEVYVGPFLHFTSIIGPNGSGKSNILDALMFCFCGQHQRPSFFDLREFIHRESTETYRQLTQEGRKCTVQVKFRLLKSPSTLVLSRELHASSEEFFHVNYQECTRLQYEDLLLRLSINPHTANYAIWQGEIDRLLLKSPSELTAHFEALSSSLLFKREYDTLKLELTETVTKIEANTNKAIKLRADKRQIRSLKQTSLECAKAETYYEDVLARMFNAQALLSESQLNECQGQIARREEAQRDALKQINDQKARRLRETAEKQELNLQLSACGKKITELTNQLKKSDEPARILAMQAVKELSCQVQIKQAQLRGLEEERTKLEALMSSTIHQTVAKEYLEAYERWQQQNSAMNRELKKQKMDLLYVQNLIEAKEALITEENREEAKGKEACNEAEKQLYATKKDLEDLCRNIDRAKLQVNKSGELFRKGQLEMAQRRQRIEELAVAVSSIETTLVEDVEETKDREMLKKLLTIEGFKGCLQQMVRPTAAKYEICFDLLIGPIRKYLLCSDEASSKTVGLRLRDMSIVKNVLILSNVRSKPEGNLRNALGKMGVMAADVVDCEKNLGNFNVFLADFLLGKVVCQNLQEAYELRKLNLKQVKQIYTLDGNVLKADGVVSSCGNVQHFKKNRKNHSREISRTKLESELQKASLEKEKMEEQLAEMRSRFKEAELVRKNVEISRLELSKEEKQRRVRELQEFMQGKKSDSKREKTMQVLKEQIRDLRTRHSRLEQSVQTMEQSLSTSQIFSGFLDKHKLSLEAFRGLSTSQNAVQLQMKENYRLQKQRITLESQLQKGKIEISFKQEKLQKMQQKINDSLCTLDSRALKTQIASQEQQILRIRQAISKKSTVYQLSDNFRSQLPALRAKLSLLHTKHQAYLQSLSESFGIVLPKFFVVDYHLLEDYFSKERVTKKKIEQAIQILNQEKEAAEKTLERFNTFQIMTTNPEDQEKLEGEINRMAEEMKVLIEHKGELTLKLETVKQQRKDTFVSFLNRLRPILSDTYRLLTEENGMSGKVEIYLESEESPFEHGLYFSPTPPSKRFVYDLEQLSGGQKSMASLALQYSLALASEGRLLILDESDAFLDGKNVEKFIRLIEASATAKRVQFILITHKQGLFGRSESVVGVAIPKSLQGSVAYSLKLC